MQRQLRVRGSIGTYRQEERLHIISASIPALKPMKFTNFKGSSAGSMMGPIILPPMSSMCLCFGRRLRTSSHRPT